MASGPRTVVALGGNAFTPSGGTLTMAGQFRFAREALGHLAPLLDEDTELVLSHGNGPQVGHMLVRVEEALGKAYAIPLEVCVAESEGELGYVLQQTLHNVLVERGIARPVVSVLTQVEVDPKDPAFADPQKPIGPFYERAVALRLEAEGFAVREERGRGFRRVVPSPEPRAIVEQAVIDQLLRLGVLVVAAGGGGIPVVRRGSGLSGVDAVIDKDLTSALLAAGLGATRLIVLTGVPAAYRHYGTDEAEPLADLTPAEVRALHAEGHFPPGSMGPKMEAAARFADAPGRTSIICDPPTLARALRGEAGTQIRRRGAG